MANVNSLHLSQLISSLTKAEKRSFKLFATRNLKEDHQLKFVDLFDAIDKVKNCTDKEILSRVPTITIQQLPNQKAHLYKQIMASLRVQHAPKIPEIEIRNLLDNASILYRRGFYHQSLSQLSKAKSQALECRYMMLALEAIEFEKKIETQHITRSLSSRSEDLTNQCEVLQHHVKYGVYFSNLCLELYGLFLKVGFVRDENENTYVHQFFQSKLIPYKNEELGFEEKMHLYNAFVWYNYIIQDFVQCYKYALLWVNLFNDNPKMKEVRMEMFLKGIHNLLNALFHLRHFERYMYYLHLLESITIDKKEDENVKQLYYLYLYTHKIDYHFLEGTFSKGVKIIPSIELFLRSFEHKLDKHRVLIFYYKIACLYFGSGDNRNAINYLNLVIQFKDQSLREDIQSFARILNLIAHFELGNDILVEYQIKSVYRFLIKQGELHGVQKEIFEFLRQLPFENVKLLQNGFKQLLTKLTKISKDPYEKRAFLYLDIISWLEAKLANVPIQKVMLDKAKKERDTGSRLYFPK